MSSIPNAERIIRAGSLGAEHLGTRVRVTAINKAIISDVLEEVRFEFDYSPGQSAENDEPKTRVFVRFRNVSPTAQPTGFDRVPGFTLAPDSPVEIG